MAEQTEQPKKARRVRIRFSGAVLPPAAEGDDPLVAASNPQPAWTLHISEATRELGVYEMWHPLDLVSGETLKLMAIERETAGISGEAYMGRIREQVQLLLPELPQDLFERLSGQQLLAIGVKAWQRPQETPPEAKNREADAGNPLAGERASASSSRSPVASTDGATRN